MLNFLKNPSFDAYAPLIRIAIRYGSGVLAGAVPFFDAAQSTEIVTLGVLLLLAIGNETWYNKAKNGGLST